MKLSLNLILLLLAFVCFLVKFLLALFGGSSGKLDLSALGATLFVASFLFG